MRIPLFRIWYSTTYTVLFVILLILLGATPADHVYQSVRGQTIQNIFVVGGVYVLTVILAIFIYASRLYTNRTVLLAIPKAYIPIEHGEVGKHVRRMIVRQLERSALIAWDSRPRDLRLEQQDEPVTTRPSTAERKNQKLVKRRSLSKELPAIPLSVTSPPWGHIAHPGWCSPASDDLPNLQYSTVIPELPNLIEAKAVSLAPPDPWIGPPEMGDPNQIVPDARVVAILQRPPTMGLRDYLGHLTSLGLIQPASLAPQFLAQYEYARFSTSPLTEEEFRELMATFSLILSGMVELDPNSLADLLVPDESGSETSSMMVAEAVPIIRSHAPRTTMRDAPSRSYSTASSTSHVSPVTARTAPSVGHRSRVASSAYRDRSPSASTVSTGSVRIHPLARTPTGAASTSSSSSARSGGSVIRLATPGDRSGLPYHIDFNNG